MSTGNDLLDYCNQEMEKFMNDMRSGVVYEYDPELIKLAEEVIKNNPNAFTNLFKGDKDE